MTEALVVFSPSGKRGRFTAGTTVLAAARSLGVDIDSVCGGRGICGRCQILPVHGQQPKHGIVSAPEHLAGRNAVEQRHATVRGPLKDGRRLGCQATICGDLVIDVPAESQLHRQIIRKGASDRPITVDPVVRLYAVSVREPDMHDPASDATRLKAALASEWTLTGLKLALPVLTGLQKALRAGDFMVTAAVRSSREIVAVYPGVTTRLAGVAIDLGSTTIAAHLCDLGSGEVLASGGIMNPQIRFGEDLMSRVSHAQMNADGAAAMTAAVQEAIDTLIGNLTAEAGVAREAVVELTLVGNPVMHHLFLGLDPTELGMAPFALAVDEPVDVRAADLGIRVAPGAFVHLLPCIAGHVGADAAAVALAEAPHEQPGVTLVVDVGTNAEILLAAGGRLLACSSPTGPAFEGAQITAGQRAAPGAIERLRIDRETLEPVWKVIGCDLWSDEPGFEAATAATGVTGLCGSGIIDAIAEMFLAGILRSDGGIDGRLAERTPRVREEYRSFTYIVREGTPRIAITQHDVRAIQLAKAALHAGCKLLLARAGIQQADRVRLAGAFGAHIEPTAALVLGLVPDCLPVNVTAAGNAAGHGALMALLSAAARSDVAALVRRIEKIETAIEPEFQAEFVAAMAFPHATDGYALLGSVVTLPERTLTGSGRRRPARSPVSTDRKQPASLEDNDS